MVLVKIVILGTASAPLPRKSKRVGTGVLVSFSNTNLLFDCGPGVVQKIINSGIELGDINTLLITHHHYDHITDIGYFVLGRWEWGIFNQTNSYGMKSKPPLKKLEVYGPSPIRKMFDSLFGVDGFYSSDIKARTNKRSDDDGKNTYGLLGISEDALKKANAEIAELNRLQGELAMGNIKAMDWKMIWGIPAGMAAVVLAITWDDVIC